MSDTVCLSCGIDFDAPECVESESGARCNRGLCDACCELWECGCRPGG